MNTTNATPAQTAPAYKLTEKETLVLKGIANSDYGNGPGSSIWSFDVCDRTGLSTRSMGGIFASLVKKGLLRTFPPFDGDEASCAMTPEGVTEYIAICRAAGETPRDDAYGILAASRDFAPRTDRTA